MNKILAVLARHRLTRYGLFFVSGAIAASWAFYTWPEQVTKISNEFWTQPTVALFLALAGLWSGQASKKNWEQKVHDALLTEPPQANAAASAN